MNKYFRIPIIALLAYPSVLPAQITPTPDDVRAFQVADALLAQMTDTEKNALCHKGSTMEQVDGIPSLGIPNFRYVDASCAIYPEVQADSYSYLYAWTNTIDQATCLPTGTALAATWDVNDAAQYGDVLGSEGRARGFDFLMGGPVNILRTPLDGRNFEFMGEDPCLVAKLIAPEMQGIQSNNIAATVKHFACNNQENNRMIINVLVDERTLREIYLPSFEAAVTEGGAYTVMNAYNQVNGSYCSENKHLLTDILKTEWGFLGFVHSDWGSVHDALNPALAGLDLEVNDVPESSLYWGSGQLATAVAAGQLSEAALNDKARRILYVMAKIHLIGGGTRTAGSLNTPAHQTTAFNIAADSIVLLKNNTGVLPLAPAALKKILVVGTLATNLHCALGGSSSGKPPYEVTPLQGLQNRLSNEVNQVTIDYVPSMSGPFTNASQYDAVLAFVGHAHTDGETEGTDLTNIQMPAGEDTAVAQLLLANSNTIVINHSGTPLEMPWITNANTVLQTWFDGQEAGNALAAVVFGDVNPCGKLPFTMPVQLADTAVTALNLYNTSVGNYAEGMLVGYRWFDAMNIQPMFPFGHGLSYTTFGYGAVVATNTVAPGGNLTVSISVTNTGTRAGAEVAQLYLHSLNPTLPSPPQALKAFQKLFLNPGQVQTAEFTLTPRDFSYWDVNLNGWHPDAGTWEILVGSSSRDIRATANVQLQPYPTIVNDGFLDPGGFGTNVVLTVDSFTQTTNGTLVLEIFGAGTNDSVSALQSVTLAGTLMLTNLNGFVASAGQSFTLIQAAEISGAFNNVVFPPLPAGLGWAVFKNTPSTLMAEVVSSRTWDATSVTSGPQDGAGTWDTTSTNWWNGSANVSWNTNSPDSALFGSGSGAAGTVSLAAPIAAANLTFDVPGSGHYILTNSALTLTSPALLTVNDNTTIGCSLTGGVVTKTGTATLSLYGASAFTDSMLVDAGTLKVVQGTSFQSPGIWISPGATLEFNTAGAASAAAIPGTSDTIGNLQTVTINGGGVVRITGTGYTVAGRGGAFTCNQPAGAWFDVQSSDIQFGWQKGAFTSNLGSLNVAAGAGFHCSDSIFEFDALTGAGTVGNSYNSAAALTVGVSGTQNNATYGVSNNTATFAGAIKDHESYNGVTTASLNLTKNGGGTQILTGTNTYQGATSVGGGSLLVNSPGSLAAASAVTVQNGGTLGGNGVIGGPVTVQSGGTLAPGSNTLGTLTINGALALNAGATNIMCISKQAGPILTSSLLAGMAGVAYGGVLKITATGTPLADGDTFTLFQKNSGTYAGSFSSFDLPALPSGLTWKLSGLAVNGSILVSSAVNPPNFTPPAGAYVSPQSITIASDPGAQIFYTLDGSTPTASSPSGVSPVVLPLPLNTNSYTISAFAMNGGFSNSAVAAAIYSTTPLPTWVAPGNASWATGSNWSNNVIANARGVTANFASRTLPANTSVTLDSTPTVGQLLFGDFGNACNWTLATGTGGSLTLDAGGATPTITVSNCLTTISAVLAGTNGLVKNGAGELVLTATNAYTGGTTVNAGTLKLDLSARSSNTALNLGTITVNPGSTLELSNNAAASYGATALFSSGTTLTGAGTITKTGQGIVDLWNGTGIGSFAGCIDIQQGVLANQTTTPDWAAGAGQMSLNVAAGAYFDLRTDSAVINQLTGAGTIGSSYYSETLTVGAQNGSSTFGGVIQNTVPAYANTPVISLTKTGTGSLTLTGTNTHTGATTISGGSLLVNGSLASGSAVTVQNGGTLGGIGTVSGLIALNGTIAPGNGVGTLATGAETWNPGASYVCELNSTNATGSDRLSISGTLNVQSTSTTPFVFRLASLTASNSPGLLAGFNKFTNYTWTIATATGGILNFATNQFTLDTSAFSNDWNGGRFTLGLTGNSLVLSYLAAPPVPKFTDAVSLGVGGMQMSGLAAPGQAYVLQGATDLAPTVVWTTIMTNFADSNGVFQFTDMQASNFLKRFYRATIQ